jgi:hypothetical protein
VGAVDFFGFSPTTHGDPRRMVGCMSSTFRYRRYGVDFGQAFRTTFDTNGPPPHVGDIVRTPMGKMTVLEVSEPDRVGRRGHLRARPLQAQET